MPETQYPGLLVLEIHERANIVYRLHQSPPQERRQSVYSTTTGELYVTNFHETVTHTDLIIKRVNIMWYFFCPCLYDRTGAVYVVVGARTENKNNLNNKEIPIIELCVTRQNPSSGIICDICD